ncbi:MAG: carboxypeptidase regulatory-like domain-containing protein [Acidobacteria bacterium]|nr:carboxypeptidase regulatory-like domain-containing protein [Acidobacteriota bacterium]
MRNRTVKACLAIAGLLTFLGGVSTPAFGQERPLAGHLVDGQGGGVGDATLFLMPVGRPRLSAEKEANLRGTPAASDGGGRVTRSAADGSFSALLPAGRYRIAAFKPGYEVSLTEVHLLVRSRVEITMRPVDGVPAGEPGGGEGRGGGLDWILRQPDGNILRDRAIDLDGPTEERPEAPPAGERRAAFWTRLPIDGEFGQHLSGGSLLGGEASGPGDSSGRSTRLSLRGPVGGQGSWRFDGRTGRTTTALDPGSDLRRGRRSSGLGIGLDYRLGPGDGLQAEMRYGTSRYLLAAGLAPDEVDQEQKTAGVRTRWDRRLGSEIQLHVGASYLEAGVRQPPGSQGPRLALTAGGPDRNGQVDRSLGAIAGLAFRADAHVVGLAVRVHSYRYELGDGGALLSSFDAGPVPLETGGQGSAVSLSGQDDWRVAERSVVHYGLGYHNDWAAGISYFVPRVGLTCALSSAGDLLVRSALVYRFEDWLQAAPGGAAPGEQDGSPDPRRFGWEIGVERRPENRLQFVATLSYRPFQEMAGDRTAPPAFQDDGVPVLADAAAGRHEMGIEVGRGFGVVRGSLAGSLGRVEGRLSPYIQESPFQGVRAGEARYYLTSLRAQFEPTETEVRIGYRRVTGETEVAAGAGNGSLDYRRLDFAVYQDLPWVAMANSRWRVLMAYQGLQYDSLDDPSLSDSGATSRVTGGVDISF